MMNLDSLYQSWAANKTEESLNELIMATWQFIYRATRDDDATQDALLYITENLDKFSPQYPDGYSRWIRTIAYRRRKSLFIRPYQRNTINLGSDDLVVGDHSPFRDFSTLPEGIQNIARSLHRGDSVEEVAERLGIKPKSLYRKIERHCRQIASSIPYTVEG